MNAVISAEQSGKSEMYELNDRDIENISGGVPIFVAAAAGVALGNAALDFGYKLGGMLYRALH